MKEFFTNDLKIKSRSRSKKKEEEELLLGSGIFYQSNLDSFKLSFLRNVNQMKGGSESYDAKPIFRNS